MGYQVIRQPGTDLDAIPGASTEDFFHDQAPADEEEQ